MPKEGWSVKAASMDRPSTLRVAEGAAWWVEVGPVALDAEIVAIQRQRTLLAALSRRPDGRLRIASFLPLDRRAVMLVRQLAARPGPGGGVHQRKDNWDYALDCSALVASHHSVEAGFSYLSYWRTGLGVDGEGRIVTAWHEQQSLLPRAAPLTASELMARDVVS